MAFGHRILLVAWISCSDIKSLRDGVSVVVLCVTNILSLRDIGFGGDRAKVLIR